jgi:predicted O-linked N-acetylglucosamine transferase (SPINDLY family)
LDGVRALLKELSTSGVWDQSPEEEDLTQASEYMTRDWPGLLAAMLTMPSWQWSEAPAFEQVPEWLWEDFAVYVFYSPQGFCAVGDAEKYAEHYLHRMQELLELLRKPDQAPEASAAVRVYLNTSNCIPLYFSAGDLRQHYEVRGQILTLAFGAADQPRLPPTKRDGRRLRVGFVNRHFGPQTETYTTLPMFEQMDPNRFEVLLFTHQETQTPLEEYARGSTAGFQVLPSDIEAQVSALRDAKLDVVVFGTNVTAVINEVTQLALHRVAPLQVVNNSSCTTTGLPEIDLYVSGTLTESPDAPAHFSERLGLLPGPAHAFNYEADQQDPTVRLNRGSVGIIDDAVVFVSAANYFKITPEMREVWARLLAAVPGSRLLLHPFNPNWSSSYPIKRFGEEFQAVLKKHGVDISRLLISTEKFPSRTDVKELLSLGDVYLDSFPFGGVNSLVDPLERGVPVLAWEGETFRSRMGAALLRNLELEELVVGDEEAYLTQAIRLATDVEWRNSLRETINDRMSRLPLFLDILAMSDSFGALLEKAHDEICTTGLANFRSETKPLLGPDVATPEYRQSRGRVMMEEGRFDRAVNYFLTAIQSDERNASLWHNLAVALHRSGRTEESVSALQSCLNLDDQYVEGWFFLAELALAVRHKELWGDALTMVRELAPSDPRIDELVKRSEMPASENPDSTPAASARRHVLVYTDDSQHGGVAQYNHSLMKGLIEAGYQVSCAQSRSDSPLVEEQRALGVTHQWIPYDTKSEFAKTLEDTTGARCIIGAVRPDLIVFSDCCPLSNLAAREVAMKLGVPYVVVVGFVGAYLADRFDSVIGRLSLQYQQAQAVVAVSQENLDLLRDKFGLPADSGQVIHYGRPERFFAPTDMSVRERLRASLSLPEDAVVCFTTARLSTVKGFRYQLEAAKRLNNIPANRRVHFVWAGEGELRSDLERAIEKLGLEDCVHLLGHRWDTADWYDAADIFVLPSELEGMPLAIMEAMAKGLPVISTAVSGIPEELADTGKLLPNPALDAPGVVEGLVDTIEAWVSDPELRKQEGARCRERAEAMFREKRMISDILALCAPPEENAEVEDLAPFAGVEQGS